MLRVAVCWIVISRFCHKLNSKHSEADSRVFIKKLTVPVIYFEFCLSKFLLSVHQTPNAALKRNFS